MAAIARSIFAVLLWAAAAAAAEPKTEILDALEAIGGDLSRANADGIVSRLAATLPERQRLEDHVRALLATCQVATTIEPREWTTTGPRTEVTLDWFLEMRRLGDGSILATQRRRQLVKTAWEKEGKRWKLVALQPVDFFAPPASQ